MSSVLLGGAGFVGSHLAEALLQAGHRVRVFDRPRIDALSRFQRRSGIEVVTGDFLNPDDLSRALAGMESAFHLVSTTLPKASNDNPVYDVETNVLGTLRLLQLCRRHEIRKIVFVSSGGTVYGVPQSIPIDEAHPTQPICSYGIQKLVIEKYLHLSHLLHGLDYCILRLANLYGERQRTDAGQGAVAAFVERALRGEAIQVWGDGSVVRDYLHVGDAVAALLKALDFRGETGTFNIGSGIGTSLNQLIKEIEALAGRKLDVQYGASRGFDVPANILSTALARRQLGWEASTTLAEGLRRTYDWMRTAR
jgi:UDP-glucose 4-epimerase